MAGRSDLEEEVARMRQELDELRQKSPSDDESGAPDGADGAGETPPEQSTLDWAKAQLEGSELDHLFREFMSEVEDLHADKPVLTVFGAFVLGYALGRAR